MPDLDDSHGLEFLQCFADRWMANPEAAGHLLDGRKPVTRPKVSTLNRRTQALRESFGQTLLQYGTETLFHS